LNTLTAVLSRCTQLYLTLPMPIGPPGTWASYNISHGLLSWQIFSRCSQVCLVILVTARMSLRPVFCGLHVFRFLPWRFCVRVCLAMCCAGFHVINPSPCSSELIVGIEADTRKAGDVRMIPWMSLATNTFPIRSPPLY